MFIDSHITLRGKKRVYMKVIKGLNTNVALALDNDNNEVIILGKGVGFTKAPYNLLDLDRVEKIFYDIDPRFAEMFASLSEKLIVLCSKIVEEAELLLDCEINPNLTITLADHLNFAIERCKNKIEFKSALSLDITHLYKNETKIGYMTLDKVKEEFGIELPESEATIIAMHIITAERENANIDSIVASLTTIKNISEIIEKELNFVIDKQGYSYARFHLHMQYMIQRLSSNSQMEEDDLSIYKSVSRKYPDIYTCVSRICEYLQKEEKWNLNKQEKLYLILHIKRLMS